MKVCIDPGHGGKDPGAIGKNPFELKEKDVNLSISLLLREELEKQGHTVFLTRDIDTFLELEDRAQCANNENADIFISIHCNGFFENNDVQGIETWIFPGATTGRKLAESVQNSLAKTFSKHTNRKIKDGKFLVVLKKTKMPAILVECEFISNPTQLKFLSEQKNQKEIAQAIASGIVTFQRGVEVGSSKVS